jgi:hypothetical protein
MKEPSFGKENLGAVIGAVLAAVGGLVAIAIPYALLTGNLKALSAARTIGLIGFFVSTPIGWFAGGYLCAALETKLSQRAAAIVGGIIGGLLPVTGIALFGWWYITRGSR